MSAGSPLRLSWPFTRDPNNKQRLPAAASPRLSVSLLAVENKSADGGGLVVVVVVRGGGGVRRGSLGHVY